MRQWVVWGWQAFWLHPVERISAALTLVLAGLSAYLAYRAICLGRQQKNLAVTQTEVAEKQGRLLDQQLARSPRLRVELWPVESRPSEVDYDVYIRNDGTGKTTGFTWYLLTRDGSGVRPKFIDGQLPQGRPVSYNGMGHTRYSDHVDQPIYANQRIELCRLREVSIADTPTLLWHIVSDEGEWPDFEKFGTLDLANPAEHLVKFVDKNREAIWWAES